MINLPSPAKITRTGNNKAVFEIESLYPGYGVTIGNSLRRVLLSSLPGAAPTQVKIKGVSHEFSTIEGVIEDAITIMLNLKKLRFKVFGDDVQRAILKVKGEKEVKASDFEFSSQVELINPSAQIATLTTKSSELEIEIQIEKGVGYSPREQRQNVQGITQEKMEIGTIPLDAIFTPVERVSYKVENMRVGKRTDFDRLFLEIQTDGIITPEEAFLQANEILINHFSLLAENVRPTVSELTAPKKEKVKAKAEKASVKKTEKAKSKNK